MALPTKPSQPSQPSQPTASQSSQSSQSGRTRRRATPDERVSAVARVLLELARLPIADMPCAEAILDHVTEAAAFSADVDRVGIWVLEDKGRTVRLLDGFQRSMDTHHAGTKVSADQAGPYFAALLSERFIVAHDAHTHEATACLSESYLQPLGISSVLDVPIMRDGKVWGVLCIEHVGVSSRQWSAAEQSLLAAMADCTSSLMERFDRLRAERSLAAQQARIERSARFANIERMVQGVAHDYRNVLTVLGGGIELIDRKRGDVEAIERNLARMRESLRDGIALCERLDAFGRIHESTPTTFDVGTFLREEEPVFILALAAMRRWSCQVDDPGYVAMDSAQLHLIMQNVIMNAKEATAPGGSIEVRVRREYIPLGRMRAGSYLVIAVTDDGCGMDPEFIARIGEPYLSSKPDGQGLGLGLPTILQIVGRCGGDVRFTSKPGSGTTVEILLPEANPPLSAPDPKEYR